MTCSSPLLSAVNVEDKAAYVLDAADWWTRAPTPQAREIILIDRSGPNRRWRTWIAAGRRNLERIEGPGVNVEARLHEAKSDSLTPIKSAKRETVAQGAARAAPRVVVSAEVTAFKTNGAFDEREFALAPPQGMAVEDWTKGLPELGSRKGGSS